MELGIVVLSYNHPQITARCVKSALACLENEGRISWPVFLVHNGSRQEHRESLQAQFPQVRHRILNGNQGYSGGVNFGLREAFKDCEWVLLLTNDCELLRLGHVPQTPGALAPKIWLRHSGHVDSWGGGVDWAKGHLRHLKSEEEFHLLPPKHRYLPGSAFLMHRKVFAAVGEFDERLGTYWEDVDWSRRAAELGVCLQLSHEIEIRHLGGKTCHKDPHYTTYLYQRNRRRVSRKFVGARWPRIRLETRLAMDHVRGLWRLAKRGRWEDLRRLERARQDA